MVEKNRALEKLEKLKHEIPFIKENCGFGSPKFKKWQLDTQTAIEAIFPLKPGHVHRFNDINYRSNIHVSLRDPTASKRAFSSGMEEADAILASMLDEIRDFWSVNGNSQNPFGQNINNSTLQSHANPQAVFVVHGRNEAIRNSLFSFLRSLGLRPLEWSQAVKETGKGSPYVGEILDKAFSLAQAVIVLMTPDDVACLKTEFWGENEPSYETQPTPQARPNVLFEAGMAMGRDPDRTILVEIGTLRPFSDIGGRHVIRLNDSSQSRQHLANRLHTAGCQVDITGTDWHSAGVFSFEETPAPPRSLIPSGSLEVEESEIILTTPNDGRIYIANDVSAGKFIMSTGRSFVDPSNGSVQVKYLEALKNLTEKGLTQYESDDFYRLTSRGFELKKQLDQKGTAQV